MRTKLLLACTFTLLLMLVWESQNNLAITNPTGAPPGYTGSPTDGSSCAVAGCHGASAQSGSTGLFSLNTTNNQYVPGREYIVSVTIDGAGRKDFRFLHKTRQPGHSWARS